MKELTCHGNARTARRMDGKTFELRDKMGTKVIYWHDEDYWLYPYRKTKHADLSYIVGDGLTLLSSQQYGLRFLTEFKIKVEGI